MADDYTLGDVVRLIDVLARSTHESITELQTEMRTGFAEVRTEMRTGFAEIRTEMRVGFDRVEALEERVER